MKNKDLLQTAWVPFGGALLVTPSEDEKNASTIIIPDTAKDTMFGKVQKVSAPSSSYFKPGDEIVFHIPGSKEITLPDCQEKAFLVLPKAILLHSPKARRTVQVI